MADNRIEDATVETTPLLGAAPSAVLNAESRVAAATSASLPTRKPAAASATSIRAGRFQVRRPQTIVFLTALLKFLVTCSGSMILLPVFRLLEDAFCHQYYGDDGPGMIDERRCKVDEVQRRLVYLGGWVAMVNAIVGLLVAMPYGILADRIGRRPTFMLSYIGLAMSFIYGPCLIHFGRARLSLYLLLSNSLCYLVGGGIVVAMSVLYAIAADVSADQDKATNFLYLTIGTSGGGMIGPVIAGKLMEAFGPWVPIFVVYCSIPFTFLLLLILPETLQIDKDTSGPKLPLTQAMRGHVAQGIKELGHSLALLKNPNILLIMAAFFVQNPLVVAYTGILAQYVSKNFGWTLAQTSYLLSPLSLLHLLVLALLPRLSVFLLSPRRSFRLSSFAKDLRLAQASFALLIAGALLEGFSQEIVLFLMGLFVGTFGAGVSPFSRAIITAHIDARHTSRLYALISIVETVGALFGGPVLAWCFDVGLRRRGIWRGLPWFYIALLCSTCLAVLSFVREPKRARVHEEGEEEDATEPDAPLRQDRV